MNKEGKKTKIEKPITTKTTKMDLKKAKAIELWRETHGHISNISRSLGIARSTFYAWMEDPVFAQALIDSEGELNDEIRDVLITKAAEGDMTAVIFYLKNRHPDFKQQPQVIQQFNVGKEMGIQVTQYDPDITLKGGD